MFAVLCTTNSYVPHLLCPLPHRAEALSDDACLTSDRLSVAYIGFSKSKTERLRIGTEVAHATRDLDNTFKVERSKVDLQGAGHIAAASRAVC